MMRSFLGIKFLLVLALSLNSQLFAANIQSVKSGAWDDPSTWSSNTIPSTSDVVTIKVGHFIQTTQINPNIEIAGLNIEATGVFHLGSRNFRVNGPINISGTFKDVDTGGQNIIVGKVNVLTGGVWNTLAITGGAFKMVFGGGLDMQGDSMLISVAQFTQSQTISGNRQIYVNKELFINAGFTLTNENTAGIFFDQGILKGANETSVFVNKTTINYQSRNAPMTPGTADFSAPGNTVIYSNPDRQFIRPTTYYDLIIDDNGDPNDENFRFLQTGNTLVLNNFTMNPHTELSAEAESLTVQGNSIVQGLIFDRNPDGLISFNNLVFDGGKIDGQSFGFGNYVINGNLTIQGTDPVLDDGNFEIKGQTTVKAGTNFSFQNGGDGAKVFNEVNVEAGANFLDLGFNGSLRFKGALNITDGAFFLRQEAFFENGFFHFGDTASFEGVLNFVVNDQEARTNQFWDLKRPINIGSGVRAKINFENGLNVRENTTYLFSEDATAIFANKGKLILNENLPKLQDVNIEFNEPGNELVMVMLPDSYVELPRGDYHSLSIVNEREENQTMFCFLPFSGIRCTGDFFLGRNISLNPVRFSLQVDGWGRIFGEVFDDDTLGVMSFGNLEAGRGRFDGNNWKKGTFTVANNFVVEDTVIVEEANFSVGGLTTIKPGGLLLLQTKEGDRSFGGLKIEEGGGLLDNTLGEDFVFDGPVELSGSLRLANGNCVFTHPVVINPTGTLGFTREWGTYNFTKGIINHGTVALSNGYFGVAGEIGGTAEIALLSDISVGGGDTLTNTNTAGFTVGGILNGENEDSYFINKGVFNYAPRAPNFPMVIGSFDAFTYPENWVNYSSINGWQEIETGDYRNIGFLNGGNKKLVGGNVQIHGDIRVSETIVRKAQDPFAVGVARMVGDGDQHISGDITGFFEELFIEKPSGKVILDNDFGITGTLLMKGGIMEAINGGLFLSNNGFLQEAEDSYILGRVASLREICEGCGNDFGGLGLKIQAGDGVAMGPTTVVRYTGTPLAPGQINRYYEVRPTNNEALNATIEFSYLERELNGAIEADLDVVASADGINFEVLGGKNLTKSNLIRKSKIDKFGYLSLAPFTMAINAYPSPFLDGNLTIDYVIDEDQFVDFRIFDQTGRTFVKRSVESTAGLNTFKLEELALPAGIYYVRVVAGEKKGFRQFVKITP